MRIFISYARADKVYCQTLADILDVHEVWFDFRLSASQQWWQQILKRLDWSEGLLYLITPNSIESPYCRRELEIALSLHKPIIPILMHDTPNWPDELLDLPYADFTDGVTIDSVKWLLTLINESSQ
jgi:hypothetical protein